MEFIPFFKKCPEVADAETRTVMIFDEKLYGIPEGQYAFIENYCSDPKCDCRKVMINIIRVDDQSGDNIGTISYGWEKLSFYTKWLYGDSELAKEMKGPSIELGGHISTHPEVAIKLFKKAGLGDSTFTDRLPKHYALFKKAIEKDSKSMTIEEVEKIGRSKPCPCGSNKKFKKCCGK